MKFILVFVFIAATSLFADDSGTLMQNAVKAQQEGDFEGAKGLLEAAVTKDPSNSFAREQLAIVNRKVASSRALQAKLDAIVLDKIDFRDVTAREGFDFLVARINAAAPKGFRLNTVWTVPADYVKNVTLSLQTMPSSKVLQYFARQADLDVSFDEFAVNVFVPEKKTSP